MAGVVGVEPTSKVLETFILTDVLYPYGYDGRNRVYLTIIIAKCHLLEDFYWYGLELSDISIVGEVGWAVHQRPDFGCISDVITDAAV
jgi:hypothetical protein